MRGFWDTKDEKELLQVERMRLRNLRTDANAKQHDFVKKYVHPKPPENSSWGLFSQKPVTPKKDIVHVTTLDDFFARNPKNVILSVTGHGELDSPKVVPLNVLRRLAADFDTLNFLDVDTIKRINLAAELGLSDVLQAYIDYRVATVDGNLEDPRKEKEYQEFLKNRFYMKEKEFKNGDKMFDKIFKIETLETDDKIILTDNASKKTINLASVLTPSYEYPSVSVFYLSNILAYLARNGVEKVSLFDYSCNDGYTPLMFWKQSDFYKKYGGKRSHNRRNYTRNRKRLHLRSK